MATNKIVLGRYEEVRDGVPLKYKIQTVTSDLIDDVIEYMMAHFLTRQPLVAHDGLLEEKHSVSSYQNFWKRVLECGESIVALEDREDEQINILGVNLLNTSRKRQTFKGVYKGEKFNKFLKFIKKLTAKGEVVFNAHDIDKYQKSCGLSVHTNYSGYKIGYRLLICQDLLCKRLGYRFICTIFTSRPAQHLAGKLHYQTIAEEKYETMEIDGQIAYPGLTGSAKLMCKALVMLKKLHLGSFVESRKSGEVLKYRIETISPELIEPVIEHMVKFFLTREPISVYDGILKQEESFNSFIKLWRNTLPTGTAMVALEERDDGVVNLVGVNVTLILEKDKEEEKFEGEAFNKVLKAVNIITERANLYERYNVDKYLSAFGLSVHEDYHGFKIGYRLLSCREALCKALSLKATGTVFSSKSAQHSAAKAGFEILAEESYDTYQIDGQVAYAGLEGSLMHMGRKYSF